VEHYRDGQRHGMSFEYRPTTEAKVLNPASGKRYQSIIVKRFDMGKVVSELRGYGADGDTLALYRMVHTDTGKRIERHYESGQLETVEEYDADGKEHGKHQHWDESGTLLYDFVYEHGSRQPGSNSWYSSGIAQLQSAENSTISVRYYSNGVLEEITQKGTDCGGEECYTRFYESGRRKAEKIKIGNLLRETTYALDRSIELHELDGAYERKSGWWPSGSLWYSGVYFNGTGSIRWWHKNGHPDQEQHYTNGQRSGTWKYWDENGRLIREEDYLMGKLLEARNP